MASIPAHFQGSLSKALAQKSRFRDPLLHKIDLYLLEHLKMLQDCAFPIAGAHGIRKEIRLSTF